jgi:hypothetical protein
MRRITHLSDRLTAIHRSDAVLTHSRHSGRGGEEGLRTQRCHRAMRRVAILTLRATGHTMVQLMAPCGGGCCRHGHVPNGASPSSNPCPVVPCVRRQQRKAEHTNMTHTQTIDRGPHRHTCCRYH